MISDWNDAYSNGAYIQDAEMFPPRWQTLAEEFRQKLSGQNRAQLDLEYGPSARHRLDLFLPEGQPKGLAMFGHGGYWIDFDKSTWSHLAGGSVDSGWAMALPSYTLAPEATLDQITRDMALALQFAAQRIDGPIVLCGHSAGGHLVTRMACQDTPLSPAVQTRLDRVVSISGLHDLRPLMRTSYRDQLRLTEDIVQRESPVLQQPVEGIDVVSWVGGDERPEFIRQSLLLAEAWPEIEAVIEPDRHHFNVIESLASPRSALSKKLLSDW